MVTGCCRVRKQGCRRVRCVERRPHEAMVEQDIRGYELRRGVGGVAGVESEQGGGLHGGGPTCADAKRPRPERRGRNVSVQPNKVSESPELLSGCHFRGFNACPAHDESIRSSLDVLSVSGPAQAVENADTTKARIRTPPVPSTMESAGCMLLPSYHFNRSRGGEPPRGHRTDFGATTATAVNELLYFPEKRSAPA